MCYFLSSFFFYQYMTKKRFYIIKVWHDLGTNAWYGASFQQNSLREDVYSLALCSFICIMFTTTFSYYRQLTESDVLKFEDVSNSDILSAFASIKKVNEQRKEERFVHSPEIEGGEQEQPQAQEVYEPGFNSKLDNL